MGVTENILVQIADLKAINNRLEKEVDLLLCYRQCKTKLQHMTMAGICPATSFKSLDPDSKIKPCGVLGSPYYTKEECAALWRKIVEEAIAAEKKENNTPTVAEEEIMRGNIRQSELQEIYAKALENKNGLLIRLVQEIFLLQDLYDDIENTMNRRLIQARERSARMEKEITWLCGKLNHFCHGFPSCIECPLPSCDKAYPDWRALARNAVEGDNGSKN